MTLYVTFAILWDLGCSVERTMGKYEQSVSTVQC